MPKKQHTEEQIIAALRQHEAGDKAAEICSKLGVNQATSTCGRSNMPVWVCRSYVSCVRCGKRTAGSSASWRSQAGPSDPAGGSGKKL